MRRRGILGLEDIKRLLDVEFNDPEMGAEHLKDHEPILDDNLAVWADVEMDRLDMTFTLTRPARKVIKNLLKRYFIRGFMMHRDIGAKTLGNLIGSGE